MTRYTDRKLFTPVQVGPVTLLHRVVMAPLTRSRDFDPSLGGYIGVTSLGTQWPSKTELVTIRVIQVKESLAPFGISRGGVRPVPCGDNAPIERINVRIVEDHSSPPGPMPLRDRPAARR